MEGGVGQGEDGGEWERKGEGCEGAEELRYWEAGVEKADTGVEKAEVAEDGEEEYGGVEGGVEEGEEGGESFCDLEMGRGGVGENVVGKKTSPLIFVR